MVLTPCATTSCSSRAIRARSSATAAAAARSRSASSVVAWRSSTASRPRRRAIATPATYGGSAIDPKNTSALTLNPSGSVTPSTNGNANAPSAPAIAARPRVYAPAV